MTVRDAPCRTLILGIGNLLMGDEGVGVHVVRHMEDMPLPPGVQLLDGGTGSLSLLEPLERADRVILVDATIDGSAPGTVRRLRPRFSADYPRTLAAHDIGLKDLLDVFHLLGRRPDVTLFAVSIAPLQGMCIELSDSIARGVAEIAQRVLAEARRDERTALQAGLTDRGTGLRTPRRR
jgi:hydrogenase maturation protease